MPARARRTAPDGARRAGQVTAPPGTPVGRTVTLWVGASGQPTGMPLQSAQVTGHAIGAAATAAVSALMCTASRPTHVPLETRAALAAWDHRRPTVWTGTNVPFAVRARLSQALGISEAAIRVIVPARRGGFGGKHGDEAAEAARLAGVPASR